MSKKFNLFAYILSSIYSITLVMSINSIKMMHKYRERVILPPILEAKPQGEPEEKKYTPTMGNYRRMFMEIELNPKAKVGYPQELHLAFEEKMYPILTTIAIFFQFIGGPNYNFCRYLNSKNWYFFLCPKTKFFLFIPRNYLRDTLGRNKLHFNKEEDSLLGLNITQLTQLQIPSPSADPCFSYMPYYKPYHNAQLTDQGLNEIFFSKEKNHNLKWSIVLAGHGGEKLLKIAGGTREEFVILIKYFNTQINTHFLYYSTCFGGDPAIAQELHDIEVSQKINFPIVSRAATDSSVLMANCSCRRVFNLDKLFFDIESGKPYEKIFERERPEYGSIPQLRMPGTNWFSLVKNKKEIKTITQVKTITHLAERKPFVIKNNQTVYVYPEVIPVPVTFEYPSTNVRIIAHPNKSGNYFYQQINIHTPQDLFNVFMWEYQTSSANYSFIEKIVFDIPFQGSTEFNNVRIFKEFVLEPLGYCEFEPLGHYEIKMTFTNPTNQKTYKLRITSFNLDEITTNIKDITPSNSPAATEALINPEIRYLNEEIKQLNTTHLQLAQNIFSKKRFLRKQKTLKRKLKLLIQNEKTAENLAQIETIKKKMQNKPEINSEIIKEEMKKLMLISTKIRKINIHLVNLNPKEEWEKTIPGKIEKLKEQTQLREII